MKAGREWKGCGNTPGWFPRIWAIAGLRGLLRAGWEERAEGSWTEARLRAVAQETVRGAPRCALLAEQSSGLAVTPEAHTPPSASPPSAILTTVCPAGRLRPQPERAEARGGGRGGSGAVSFPPTGLFS